MKWDKERERMVKDQIASRGIRDENVIKAMLKVPRHLFVPEEMKAHSYADTPLPIGKGQTISQPYIVALMTELMRIDSESKVLEIGTGSGYQTAILAEIAKEVYTVEIIEELHKRAVEILRSLGYTNVYARCDDGYFGWEEHAPYDGIMVTAAPKRIPEPLIKQLKIGGRLVIPVGEFYQDLIVVTKSEHGTIQESVTGVRFVPMTGEAERRSKESRRRWWS
jgi:protein-L-isoaspartate(D-aspartate) O-methyltransferase